jgi:AcrR family transcriptional regulator
MVPDVVDLARQWPADLVVRESLEFAGCAAKATAEAIIAAARLLFARLPYDEVSLPEVAKQAGVTVQTVLRRFGSKDKLFAAAARERSGRAGQPAAQACHWRTRHRPELSRALERFWKGTAPTLSAGVAQSVVTVRAFVPETPSATPRRAPASRSRQGAGASVRFAAPGRRCKRSGACWPDREQPRHGASSSAWCRPGSCCNRTYAAAALKAWSSPRIRARRRCRRRPR